MLWSLDLNFVGGFFGVKWIGCKHKSSIHWHTTMVADAKLQQPPTDATDITNTANTTSPNQTRFLTQVKIFWKTLTTPAASVIGEDIRQARLALGMLVVLLPLVYLTTLYQVYYQFGVSQDPDIGAVVMVVTISVILTLAYVLTRTERYRIGQTLFVIAPTATITFSILVTGDSTPSSFFMYYLVFSVMLASLLLDVRATAIMGVVNFGVGVFFIMVIEVWNFNGMFEEILFNVVFTTLLIVSAVMRQQYITQIRTQIVELQTSQQAEKTAREEAERANVVKSAFLASMSHELRTPLNSIINFSKFLERGLMGDVNEQQTETLSEIIDNSEHLLSLINDVLDMSKIESGSLKLFVEENVDVQDILQTTVSTARSLLNGKSVNVITSIDENLPGILGDRQRILQVMLNVISNACKFTKTGEIEIKAHSANGEIHLAVRDTGHGISEDDSAAVFEAFKQTQSGLRQGGGTGLGMPITKSLVEAHGGRMWFNSVVGQGTTFHITLPVKSDKLTPTL